MAKIVEDGITYNVEETDGCRVQIKADPSLVLRQPLSTFPVGTTANIRLDLIDFDGEPRTDDTSVQAFIGGTSIPFELDVVGGVLALALDLKATGEFTVSLVPGEIKMDPFTIVVV